MPIKQADIDKYIKTGGNSCLNCGSGDIEGGSVEIDSSYATQEVSCNECGYAWKDEYTLTGVGSIEDDEGKSVTIEEDN